MENISPENLDFLKKFFFKKCGIALGDDKKYLLQTRLAAATRSCDNSINVLINKLKAGDKELISECLDALLINETYFFRDLKLFDLFAEDILPAIVTNSGEKIKIWSAACSSGQEPYSIVITLLENREKLKGKSFEVLATDISGKALSKALEGIYSEFEMQRGMNEFKMKKYFEELPGNKWKIKDEVKKYVSFKEQNLIDNFNFSEKFDAVFCRYVLIYFNEEMKRNIFRNICEVTKPGGPILLGTAETTNPLPYECYQYEKLRSAFFRK